MTTERARAEVTVPAEMTLAEAARVMGIDRSNAYRRLRPHLQWAMHSGRRVRMVKTRHVFALVVSEKGELPAFPELQQLREKLAAYQIVLERQALWIAKASKRLGIPV